MSLIPKYECLPRNYKKRKPSKFQGSVETRPHYENDDCVFFMTMCELPQHPQLKNGEIATP